MNARASAHESTLEFIPYLVASYSNGQRRLTQLIAGLAQGQTPFPNLEN